MKSKARLCFVAFLFSTTSCSKWDEFCKKPDTQEPVCELLESRTITAEFNPIYRKEINSSTGKADKVVASKYSIVQFDTISLNLRYAGNKIYMLPAGTLGDTLLIASFNSQGRIESLLRGNTRDTVWISGFQSAQFYYSGNRLSSFEQMGYEYDDPSDEEGGMFGFPDREIKITYDNYGNVTRLFTEGDEPLEITYSYDLNVKAKGQFYPDDFGGDFNNSTIYLAQFMGWLPDLTPVNKRTGFVNRSAYYGSEHSRQYVAHVYDSNGNLLRYNESGHNKTLVENTWSCNNKN